MPVFIVDKPLHLSSHDVVAKARKLLKTKAVGHAGTLDPLATGVLVVLSEDATKLSPFVMDSDKSYLAWVSFGASTATLDAEGPIVEEKEVRMEDLTGLEPALPHFLNLTEQFPPAYSAIKQAGITAYKAARQGQELSLAARPVRYHDIKLLGLANNQHELTLGLNLGEQGWYLDEHSPFKPTLAPLLKALPTALFFLKVQAGTYIRAFARDLGQLLGMPAHLSGLVRTHAGKASLAQACSLANIAEHPLTKRALLNYPEIQLSTAQSIATRQGKRLDLELSTRSSLISPEDHLVAIAVPQDDGPFKLLRVWQEAQD